nr:TonB-dependent receptor plug domain-containing protein [Cytophagales bacterium]
MRISWLCLMLLVGSFSHSWAQEKDTVDLELDPVVVTGTRFEQKKRKVSAAVSVITRETIERSGEVNVLPVIAREVPGFFLNDRSMTGFGVGPGSGGNISIRGISGSPNNRVLVLIDGQPQYMGIFAHPIADAYSASDVERVEVQRGAASLLYGSNAMGGAVNLITRRATKEGWQGGGSVGFGSFGTLVASANARYKRQKFHAMVSVNRNQTNGFREDANDSFENTTAYVKVGYDLSSSLSLSGDLQLADATYYQPGTMAMPSENDRREFERGRAAISLDNDWGKVSGALLFFNNFGDHVFQTGFSSRDQNQGVTFYQNITLIPGQILTLGVDHKRFGGKATNDNLPPPARIGLGVQHWVTETDVYAHLQQDIGEKLTANVGVRQVSNSQFGGKTLPGLGVAFQVTGTTTLKASTSKAFRSPSVVDLFLFPPSNELLRPEEMWNHDLGFQTELMNGQIGLEATAFIAEGKNLIQVNPMDIPPVGRNTGSFSNSGIETQLRYKAPDNFGVVVNYAYINASGNVLFAPTHNLNVHADLTAGKFSLVPSVQVVSGLRTSVDDAMPKQSYALLGMVVMYQLTPAVSLFVNGRNLLDVDYQLENGFPMPGVNVLTGIHIKR